MNKSYKVSKDTGKFWSFRDTKNYKNGANIILPNSSVVRTFIFQKSYLLKVKNRHWNTELYLTPYQYISHSYPNGYYKALDTNGDFISFTDNDIVEVLT